MTSRRGILWAGAGGNGPFLFSSVRTCSKSKDELSQTGPGFPFNKGAVDEPVKRYRVLQRRVVPVFALLAGNTFEMLAPHYQNSSHASEELQHNPSPLASESVRLGHFTLDSCHVFCMSPPLSLRWTQFYTENLLAPVSPCLLTAFSFKARPSVSQTAPCQNPGSVASLVAILCPIHPSRTRLGHPLLPHPEHPLGGIPASFLLSKFLALNYKLFYP